MIPVGAAKAVRHASPSIDPARRDSLWRSVSRLSVFSAQAAALEARDLRIDAVRGCALWMIFIDHIAGNPFSQLTYKNFGLSDATEIFIFLSGVSAAIAYGRAAKKQGWAMAQAKALYRVFHIYVAYLASALVSIGVIFACVSMIDARIAQSLDITLLLAEPGRALSAVIALYYTPYVLSVLPVYLILIGMAPMILRLVNAVGGAILAASAGVYVGACYGLHLKIPNLNAEGVFGIDPFTWQLLFCLGLFIGKRVYDDGSTLNRVSGIYAAAWVVIAINFAFGVSLLVAPHLGLDMGAGAALRLSFASDELKLLPLLHFLAVAYVFALHIPANARFLRHPALRPLVASGQNSLEIFSLGVPMSIFLSVYFLHYRPNHLTHLLLTVAGLAVLAAAGLALAAVKNSERNAKKPVWRAV